MLITLPNPLRPTGPPLLLIEHTVPMPPLFLSNLQQLNRRPFSGAVLNMVLLEVSGCFYLVLLQLTAVQKCGLWPTHGPLAADLFGPNSAPGTPFLLALKVTIKLRAGVALV